MTKVYDNATDIITFARLQAQNTTSGSSYLGSDGLLKFAAEDEPRIEYAADGSLKGLLIEEQRTNLVPHSEDFSQWTQVLNVDLDTDGTIAPDGSLATRVTDNSTNWKHRCFQANVSAVPNHTFSVFLKAGTLQYVQLLVFDSVISQNYFANFDVINQTVTREQAPSGGTITTDVTPVGNGWARYSIATSSADAANIQILCLNSATVGGSPSYSGSGDTLYIYGAQLEQGSFATSYIPTSGSQSTRSPDIASIPVSAFGYNQDAGTVVVEFDMLSDNAGTVHLTQAAFGFHDGTSNNRLELWSASAGTLTLRDRVAPTNYDATSTGNSLEQSTKSAASYASGEASKLVVNGGTASVAGTATTPPAYSTLLLGDTQNVDAELNGHIKSLQYYPRRLTDAQLQELTS